MLGMRWLIPACTALLWISACCCPSAAAGSPPSILALPTLDSVTVKLLQPEACAGVADIDYAIRHWPDGERLASGVVPSNSLEEDRCGNIAFSITGLRPKPWTLQDPQLYTIALTAGERAIGSARFGFRTFAVRDCCFYFNGRPLFLRSVPINPPGRDLPEATGRDPEFIRGYLRLLKSAGVNLVRTDGEEWLNACDEIGILASQGRYGPAYGGTASAPPPVETAKSAYRDMVCALANHPSVVIYYFANEVSRKTCSEFLEAIHRFQEDLDSTRPAIGNAGFGLGEGGDIYDIHRYSGWYYGSAVDWYELKDYLSRSRAAGQPLTISECVAAYTADSGVFQTVSKQMATALRWSGAGRDQASVALDYSAELTRQVVEIARRQRTAEGGVAAVMPFTYFFGWSNANSAADLRIKPAFEVLKTVFQPVLISPECWKRNLYAGDTLEMALCVINDSDECRDLASSQAVVEVVSCDGNVAASVEAEFPPVAYYSNSWRRVTVPLPEDMPRGDYTVRLRLIEGGSGVSTNSFGITVAPRERTRVGGIRASVYDPAGATAAALRDLGFDVTSMPDLSTLPESGLVVIGEEAFAGAKPSRNAVAEFMGRGGRIVCLRQKSSDWSSDWLPASFTMSAHGPQTYIHPVGGSDAVFAGLRERDLRLWNEVSRDPNGRPEVCPVLELLWPESHEDLANCRVWAASEQLLSGAALIEVIAGRGSALISQFDCVRRVSSDPIAARLLSGIVSYATASEAPQRVDLSRPVKWDLAAIADGVFCSKTQGLLPHSPVYEHTGKSKGDLGGDHAIDGFSLVGDYDFNRFGWVKPVPDPDSDGWGVFYGRLSRPARAFVLTLRNDSDSAAGIDALLDGISAGRTARLKPRERREVRWPIDRRPGPVKVELRGDRRLVLLESRFE